MSARRGARESGLMPRNVSQDLNLPLKSALTRDKRRRKCPLRSFCQSMAA